MRKSTHTHICVCVCACVESQKSTNEIFIFILSDSQRAINIFNIRFYTQFTRAYISRLTSSHPWRGHVSDSQRVCVCVCMCVCFNPFRHAEKKQKRKKCETHKHINLSNKKHMWNPIGLQGCTREREGSLQLVSN